MTVADEVTAELDRLGVDGYKRATAVRLAETVDERGTASAASELLKLMAEFDAQGPAPDEDLVSRLKSEVRERKSAAGIRQAAKRQGSAPSSPIAGKGRRNAPVR